MYSLYPNRTTGFFWRVDRRNHSLANAEAFSFAFEDPLPVPSESDSRRSDSFLSVLESDTFFFPFSLRVSRLPYIGVYQVELVPAPVSLFGERKSVLLPELEGFTNLCLPATKFGQSEHYLFRVQVLKPLIVYVAYPLVP